MWNPFKSKPLLSEQDSQFQIDTFKWLLKYFGGDDFYRVTKLVLPIRSHFPQTLNDEEQAAEATFAMVKEHAGLANWPCVLRPQAPDIEARVAPTLAVVDVPYEAPLGTFSVDDDNTVVITYNPAIVNQPVSLVATLAHELAHYFSATAPEPPPGGWENWEFATDICATFLGFGVFMANSARNFQQFSSVDAQGWKSSRSGYLTEAEHCYALALFIGLKNVELDLVLRHLKPGLRPLLKKAVKALAKTEVITQLKAVEFEPPSLKTD